MSSVEINVYHDGCSLLDIHEEIKLSINESNLCQGNKVSFVGIITSKEKCAVFLPKRYKFKVEENPRKDAKNILNLLTKYQASHKYDQKLFGLEDQVNVEMLTTLSNYRILLDFYREKGLYRRRTTRENKYGRGRINWSKTTKNETPILVNDDSPVYIQYHTTYAVNKEVSSIVSIQKYFTALADSLIGWIFTESNAQVLYPELALSLISPPGTKNFMLHQLMKERSQVFDNDRLRLLTALISILENKSSSTTNNQTIGVKYFWPIWEASLKVSFNDSSKKVLETLPVPSYQYEAGSKIAPSTLIPDIVIFKDEDIILLDAKYYDTENTLPSWQDIIKQSFYKNTLEKITGKRVVLNAFVFPGEKNRSTPLSVHIKKRTENEAFDNDLYPEIQCLYYSVKDVISYYLADKEDTEFFS